MHFDIIPHNIKMQIMPALKLKVDGILSYMHYSDYLVLAPIGRAKAPMLPPSLEDSKKAAHIL